jgi:hypothetical protein
MLVKPLFSFVSERMEILPNSLRTFLNQSNVSNVVSFVAECIALFPLFLFFSAFFVLTCLFQASAQMPRRGIAM